MKLAVAGGATVVGRCTLPDLASAGHDLVLLGHRARSLPSVDVLAEAMEGCDAVLNLAAQIPAGPSLRGRRAWRLHDDQRTDVARRVVDAARMAGVRRLVHQSASVVYADGGAEWITESSPLCVTPATESASVGEMVVQDFSASCRTGVVLRLGLVMGDSGMTRWMLQSCAEGRPVGLGDPDGYAHVVHSDDVAAAVLASLEAPSGIYNVGADPVRRAELVDAHAAAVGRARGAFMGPFRARLAGARVEPLARSLRVSSESFSGATGWSARRPTFDASWLEAAGLVAPGMR